MDAAWVQGKSRDLMPCDLNSLCNMLCFNADVNLGSLGVEVADRVAG